MKAQTRNPLEKSQTTKTQQQILQPKLIVVKAQRQIAQEKIKMITRNNCATTISVA